MKAYVGQVIKHPIRPGLEGTITNTFKYGDPNIEDSVIVSWHDGTEGSLYDALVEAVEPQPELQKFEVGDEVTHVDDSPITCVGEVINYTNGVYGVRWNHTYG